MAWLWRKVTMMMVVMIVIGMKVVAASTVPFYNCNNNPSEHGTLFIPTGVDALLKNWDNSSYRTLEITVEGNVTGGSIIDLDVTTNRYTTLRIESKVLEFTYYDKYARFCDITSNPCPLPPGPVNFSYSFNVSNAYQGVSLDTVFYIIDANNDGKLVGCVALESTPVMAAYVWYVLVFAILATFIGLAIIYILASWLNPWTGTKDILVWSSNIGYDSNAIRLITPGISEFLRYLQFSFFLASLNLNYPGFFRPVLATVSWSCLLFHFNFVSDENKGFYDNLYIYNGDYGISKMARIVELINDKDIWPSFIIWFLIVSGIVLVVFAIVYLLTSKWHKPVDTASFNSGFKIEWKRGGLFLTGMIVRLFLIFFSLPLLTTSFFQMVIVKQSPIVSDVLAMILIILWVSIAGFIVYKVNLMTKRLMNFSEDLPKLLVYGPLFNIFKDGHIMYFAIELLVVFLQGLTFGALQSSGIAQITILSVIEIGKFITLICYKPYRSGTSMTMVSSLFSAIRIIEIFLLIPFIYSLDTDSTVRGWVGYIILIIHAVILLLFIVHIAQVLFELFARLGGAGKDDEEDKPAKGEISAPIMTSYNMKQLRLPEDDKSIIPQSPTELVVDNGYRRPKSQYSNIKPLIRDNAFEDVFIASPTSEISTNGTSSIPTTSANYYRRPRRRQSSHDWGVETNETQSPATERTSQTLINTKTDYAVREADLYITKRTATNSLYDEVEVDDDYSRRDSESVNPLMHKERESISSSPIKEKLDSSQALLGGIGNSNSNSNNNGNKNFNNNSNIVQKGGLYGSVKGIMDKVGGKLRPNQRRDSEEITSGKGGFEVMNRQAIKPYKVTTGNVLGGASKPEVIEEREHEREVGVAGMGGTGGTGSTDGILENPPQDISQSTSKNIEQPEDTGFIFHLPSSVGPVGPSRLRVVTDPITNTTTTNTTTPRLITPYNRRIVSDYPRRSLSKRSEISESSSVYQSINEDADEDSPINDKSTSLLRSK